MRGVAIVMGVAVVAASPASRADAVVPFIVTGDAIEAPLADRNGDAARGRAIVLDRANGNCLMCHQVPDEPGELQQGTVGPALAGIAARLSAGQIRLRLVDQSRVHPDTVMPPYHRADGLNRVAAPFRGRPYLDAQSIEDVVAYLATLR
jgi:sulfur-oxidizing protein SoxX